jgi:hypothetical protein
LHERAAAAVSVLSGQLDDADPVRRCEAACALAHIRRDPERLLPVLMALLQEPVEGDPRSTTWKVVSALEIMGPAAKPAYHLLFKLWQSDRHTYNRLDLRPSFNCLGMALLQIDPEAAKAAGVKWQLD